LRGRIGEKSNAPTLTAFARSLCAQVGDGCAFLAVAARRSAKDAHALATHAMREKGDPGILILMNPRCLQALQARRPALQTQWAERLRAAPVTSPLANPETLIHLMDRTLDQVFFELGHPSAARRRQPGLPRDFCRCGHNPLVMYFATAAQAFETTLAQCADEMPVTRDDADQVKSTLTRIARREIMTFCALCQRQADNPHPGAQPRACAGATENQTQTPTA
jgi:hypothetical protein